MLQPSYNISCFAMLLLKKINLCILVRPKKTDAPFIMTLSLPSIEDVQKKIGSANMYAFFQNTENFLNQKFQLKKSDITQQKINPQSLIKKIGFYFLTITGLIKHGLGSYLFGLNLFSLIKGLSEILLNILTLSYSLLDSFFFLAFEINLLQKNFSLLPNKENPLIQETKQMSLIYMQLSDIQLLKCLTRQEYIQLVALSEYYLQHLSLEHQQLKTRLNTPGSKFFSYFLITLGGISKVSSNYFFCQTFLKAFLPQLVGTIIGLIFTATIILSSLGLYFSVNGAGIYQYMHGETKILNQLECEIPKLEAQAQRLQQYNSNTLNLFDSLPAISL